MRTKTRWIWAAIAAIVILAFLLWPRGYCGSAKRAYGIEVPVCPDGTPRPVIEIQANGLRRGAAGHVYVILRAAYTSDAADTWNEAIVPEFSVELAFVDRAGNETALKPEKGWSEDGYGRSAKGT